VQHEARVGLGRKLGRVADEQDSSGAEQRRRAHKERLEDVPAGRAVQRGEDVVEKQQRRARVDGTRERDALLLPAGEGHAALADDGRVAVRQRRQVGTQGASVHDGSVACLVERGAKEDVVSHRHVLHPCCLRAVGDCLAQRGAHAARLKDRLAQHARKEGGLATPDGSGDEK